MGRKRGYSRGGRGLLGGGMVKKLAFGAVAGYVALKVMPGNAFVAPVAGYLVGGIPGAAAAYFAPGLLGKVGGGASTSAVYQ